MSTVSSKRGRDRFTQSSSCTIIRSVTGASQPRAIELTLELLDVARKPSRRELRAGYIDLLGDVDPTGPHPGQRWMTSRTLPLIYERIWRPLGAQLLMGATGPGTRGEQRIALAMLAPTGKLALLSSCSRGPLPAGVTSPLVKVLTGVHMFSREEITDALAARGLVGIRQHVRGLAQFVCARKPAR